MAVVALRAPLSQRAGGDARHDLPGSTVGEVLRELESRHPPIVGERIREDSPVEAADVLQLLPSISGG